MFLPTASGREEQNAAQMRLVSRLTHCMLQAMNDPNQPQFPAPAPIVGQRAADVQAPQIGEGNQVTYTYPIRQPEEDFNDFQVGVRASLLKRCRVHLQAVAAQGFPLPELLLGISTLTAGAALSAVISGVQLGSWRGVVFFVILPMVAVGSGVAYGDGAPFSPFQYLELDDRLSVSRNLEWCLTQGG